MIIKIWNIVSETSDIYMIFFIFSSIGIFLFPSVKYELTCSDINLPQEAVVSLELIKRHWRQQTPLFDLNDNKQKHIWYILDINPNQIKIHISNVISLFFYVS